MLRAIKTQFLYLWLALSFVFALASPALAEGEHPHLQRLQDVAMEIEIEMQPELMALLTTTDGTLAPLIEQGLSPVWLRYWALREFPDVQTLAEIRWDQLGYENQLKLLQHYGQNHALPFRDSRKIKGMRVRDTIAIKFDEPETLFNHSYEAGVQMVEIGKILNGAVEYGAPSSSRDIGLIELHVRSNLSAGTTYLQTNRLLSLLGFPQQSAHMHIVSPEPFRRLKSSSPDNPTRREAYIEYIRRLNIIAEMISIMEGCPIQKVVDSEGRTAFTPLNFDTMMTFVSDVFIFGGSLSLLSTDGPRLMGYVSPRNESTYDRRGLLGAEYRALGTLSKPKPTAELLDAIQTQLLEGSYGLPEKTLKRWFNRNYGSSLNTLIESYYNSDQTWLKISQMPLRFSILFILDRDFEKFFSKLSLTEHFEVKMLVHNWSDDPIVFDHIWLKLRIRREQIKALKRLQKNRDTDVNEVMKDFLRDSGLAQVFLESVGLGKMSCEEFLK